MSKNDESILTKLDFDDKAYLISFYENFVKSSNEEFIQNYSIFKSNLVSNKTYYSANQYNRSGQPNSQVASSLKVIKIYSLMSIFKDKYYHIGDIESNLVTEINLLMHNIHKVLIFENETKNENSELDILCNIIFGKYFSGEKFSFEKFKSILDMQPKSSTQNTGKTENAFNVPYKDYQYDGFVNYFKIIVKFFLYADKVEKVYQILNQKNKLMTAELVVCLNKLGRKLTDSNHFNIISKKFIELINTNEVYISKEDFYSTFIRALVV